MKQSMLLRTTGRFIVSDVVNTSYIHAQCQSRSAGLSQDQVIHNVKPFDSLPGPKGLPFLGTLLNFKYGRFHYERLQDLVLDRYRKYGPISKEMVAGETVLHLFHPDYVQAMYQQEGKTPFIPPLVEASKLYRKVRDMSLGLGNTNGEEWYRLRSSIQTKLLKPQEVASYLPNIEQIVRDFLVKMDRIRDERGEIQNFYNELLRWSLESSGMTCFETRLGVIEADANSLTQKMLNANGTLLALGTKLKYSIPIHKWITTPTWKKQMEAEDYFFSNAQKFVDGTVANIKNLMDKGQLKDGQYSFLVHLLSKKELSYKDVSILTLSLFGDALNTTVPSLIFNLYCLASNPSVQEKLIAEIDSIVPKNESITTGILGKLSYLKACIKETFRMFPIQIDIARIPQQDVIIGGYRIPAGTRVEFHNFVNFRDPEYFPDPERYMPERWLRGGSASKLHPYLLTPFSHGPRMCIGRRLAEQEMYVFLSRTLQKFKVEWHHGEMGQKFRILMIPDCPAQFSFRHR